MSEIIAAVYDTIEETGIAEGICSWTKSTVSLRRWRRRCCSFCSSKSLAGTGCRKDGWSSQR
jgi:hypothetical protein